MLLGCIADDFTGATDLANTLVRGGLRTVQLLGLPDDTPAPDAEAVVVALKSRTIPAAEAVAQSLAAADWLLAAGARQLFFKYCSTFDSTPAGNIGPVAEALMARLSTDVLIACPAFPQAGRTVYRGHLFVGDALLSESGMESHPLTPMTDSNLVRVLAAQTTRDIGLVPVETVAQGPAAIAAALGPGIAIVDALTDEHLHDIGAAAANLKLVTGGSGVAMGLPANFRRAGLVGADAATNLPAVAGLAAVLSGSCSVATRGQVARFAATRPSYRLDPLKLAVEPGAVEAALAWAAERLDDGPVLIYASAAPEEVAAVQEKLGRSKAGEVVETAMAALGAGLVARGVRRLVVAGGETSGAVIGALGMRALRIGAQIDPGVPCTVTLGMGGTPWTSVYVLFAIALILSAVGMLLVIVVH